MRDAYDAVVVGGGSAGCVLAARLSDNPGRSVLLLEAGPDYGPYKDGRWPDDILDGRRLPMASHDWGFAGGDGGASKNKLPTSSWRRPSCAVGCPHPGSSLCSKPPSWMPSTRSGYPFSRDSTGLGGDPDRPGSPKHGRQDPLERRIRLPRSSTSAAQPEDSGGDARRPDRLRGHATNRNHRPYCRRSVMRSVLGG